MVQAAVISLWSVVKNEATYFAIGGVFEKKGKICEINAKLRGKLLHKVLLKIAWEAGFTAGSILR
jgi:hypothetical protein